MVANNPISHKEARSVDPVGSGEVRLGSLSEIGLVEIAPRWWVPALLADWYRREYQLSASSPARATLRAGEVQPLPGTLDRPRATGDDGTDRAEPGRPAVTVPRRTLTGKAPIGESGGPVSLSGLGGRCDRCSIEWIGTPAPAICPNCGSPTVTA